MKSNLEYQLYDRVFWDGLSGSIIEIRSTETGPEYLVHFEGPCASAWCRIEAVEPDNRLKYRVIFC
jgi:hypothetical protein